MKRFEIMNFICPLELPEIFDEDIHQKLKSKLLYYRVSYY